LVTFTHRDIQHKFRVPFDSDKHVAIAEQLVVVRAHTLLLLTNEAPHLIAFHVADLDIADLLGHDALALFASDHEELQDCGVVNIGCSFDARHAVTFEQETEHHFSLFDGQVHPIEAVIAGIRENLAALRTLVALAVITLSEFPAFGTAIMAGHFGLAFFELSVQNGSGRRKPCLWRKPEAKPRR
jgi:hypothetical protein